MGLPLCGGPHASTSCLSIGRVLLCNSRTRKGVTVEDEDGTDIPAELLAFNSASQSDPVDRGLPSATSYLRVRAQLNVSYSHLHLHVNGGTALFKFGQIDQVHPGA